MARQPRTPGATEAPKTTEVAAPTTAQQSDDVLNEILGTPDTKDAEPTASTEPTSEPVQAAPTNAELLEIINGLKSQIASQATAPVAQHVPTYGAVSEPVAKRTRHVCGPNGWTTEEY
jgi:hypothetical protein